jgi:hypothetical protein
MLEMQRLDLYHALNQTDARLRLVKSDRRNAIDQTKLARCLVRSDRELWFGVALFFFLTPPIGSGKEKWDGWTLDEIRTLVTRQELAPARR